MNDNSIPFTLLTVFIVLVTMFCFFSRMESKSNEPTDMHIQVVDNTGEEHDFIGLLSYDKFWGNEYLITSYAAEGSDEPKILESTSFVEPVSVSILSGLEEKNPKKENPISPRELCIIGLLCLGVGVLSVVLGRLGVGIYYAIKDRRSNERE